MSRHKRDVVERDPGALRVAWFLVVGTLIVLPLLIDPFGKDAFRLPKEALFRIVSIALGVVIVFLATNEGGRRALARIPKRFLILAGVAVAWTALATVFSTNARLSVDSLVTVTCSALFFIGCCLAMMKRSMVAFELSLIAPALNSAFAVLQEYNIWQPWALSPQMSGHVATTALVGNPNDVGTYLLAPALGTLVASTVSPGRRRFLYAGLGILLLAGLIASATRTAIIAFVAALVVVLFRVSRRGALVVVMILSLTSLAVLSERTLVGRSARQLVKAAKEKRYDILLSERLPPFLAAYQMFRDDPATGVGPGTFKWHYMKYRMDLSQRYPEEWTRGWPMNFGETHNDHLQTLAETGAPGYLVLLCSFAILVLPRQVSVEGRENTTTERFARALRLPLAVAFFTVMLAQFPMQLAVTRVTFIYFGTMCAIWSWK